MTVSSQEMILGLSGTSSARRPTARASAVDDSTTLPWPFGGMSML